MVRIAPIKLQYSPKTLWFDPEELDIHKGDAVVVTTARGLEFGHATDGIIEVEEAEVKKLKTELKPVKRIATPEDVEMAQKMQEKSDEALPIFKEMASEANEDMHPVSVEFLLDGDKAIFYFEAEERVDFRELVRKLASRFHARIDMRQIGVRDEARIVGGLGHCGQELCCKRLGGEFCPVSIRMAKEQDLSLNPQKISGVCGRLMCCLRYEFDAYKDFKDRAPKINASIETPEGPAKVIDLNVPREIVTIKLGDDKTVKIPLSEFEETEKGVRPHKIGTDAFEQYANQNMFEAVDSLGIAHFGDKSLFDGPLKKDRSENEAKEGRTARNGQGSESSRKPRRRTRVGKDGQSETSQASDNTAKAGTKPKKRSGQKNNKAPDGAKDQNRQEKSQTNSGKSQGQSRRRRNRGSEPKQGQERSGQNRTDQQRQGPRPGQKSSGLRKSEGSNSQERRSSSAEQRPPRTDQSNRSSQSSRTDKPARSDQQNSPEQSGHRRSRRRSHKTSSPDTGGSDEV